MARSLADAKSCPGQVTPSQHGYVGGAGATDVTAFKAAIADAVSQGRPLVLGAGTFDLSAIGSAQQVDGVLTIHGAGKHLTRVVGAANKRLVDLVGGSSIFIRDVGFDTWEGVVKLLDNSAGEAFDVIDVRDCYFTNIAASPVYDPVPADGGINELRFSRNTVVDSGRSNFNAAGLRIDSKAIYSGFVEDNEIRNIGGPEYSAQKGGIYLGAVTVTPLTSLLVRGNRIRNVQNSDQTHLTGITVLGRSVRVVDNSINTVKSADAGNVNQYGIYGKVSYSVITGNTCIDAGANAATIMLKGFPNDLNPLLSAPNNDCVIADNCLLITERWALGVYIGIVTYNSGMDIHDNIIEGYNKGIVQVDQESAENRRHLIHHNKLRNLAGTAGQTVLGVELVNPSDIVVEGNEFDGVGSGVEATVRGISAAFSRGLTTKGLTVRGNTVRAVTAAVASDARGITVSMDPAGTLSDLLIDGNFIEGAGRGIRINYAGTISGVAVTDNRLRDCTASGIDATGQAPGTARVANNTLDGVFVA